MGSWGALMTLKPSFEECQKIGAEFEQLRRTMLDLYVKASNMFGSTVLSDMRKAITNVEMSIGKMDSKVFKCYPDRESSERLDVFYPLNKK